MTGVEGYLESAASGLIAGLNVASENPVIFGNKTAIGSLAKYISDANVTLFQPMNVNFGLMAPLEERTKKKDRKEALSKRALEIMTEFTEKKRGSENENNS